MGGQHFSPSLQLVVPYQHTAAPTAVTPGAYHILPLGGFLAAARRTTCCPTFSRATPPPSGLSLVVGAWRADEGRDG